MMDNTLHPCIGNPPPPVMPTMLAEDTTYVDVLIVGAGPAGLMAAHALAQAGVKIKIIDMKQVTSHDRRRLERSLTLCP